MKASRRKHLVFIGDLQMFATREVCRGAAEYAADRPDLDFDPWPVVAGRELGARRSDIQEADCLIASDIELTKLFGKNVPLRIPYVNVGDHRPRLASVELDDEATGRLAAEHLLGRGYPHLAFVGSRDQPWSRLRKQGFVQTATLAGKVPRSFEFAADVLPTNWSWKSERRRASLAQLLAALPKPCGIFAANDVIACFMIETARDGGIRIPEQIGVLGVDNDPIPNAAAGMAISSIEVPFREMGRQAAEMVDQLRHSKPFRKRVLLPPTRVVARTSTNAFMVDDRLVRRAQEYIEAHRHSRIKVAEVARAVGSTRVTLGQRFGRHLGLGVLEYILQRRMGYAQELLRTGDLNVDQVAQACGFHSAPLFHSVFKRVMGITPGQARAGDNASTRE